MSGERIGTFCEKCRQVVCICSQRKKMDLKLPKPIESPKDTPHFIGKYRVFLEKDGSLRITLSNEDHSLIIQPVSINTIILKEEKYGI